MKNIKTAIEFFKFQQTIQLTATRAMIHCNGRKRLGKKYLREMGSRISYYKKAVTALEMLNKQQWIPSEKEKPETYIYDRLWLTIKYPRGFYRTIEGRYNRYEDVYLHINQKPIKEKVVAWKEYGVPSPFQPVDQ